MRLTYIALGTGGGQPTRLRACAGAAFEAGEALILADPGEGATRALTLMARTPARLAHIHISRFTVDACAGLAGLLAAAGEEVASSVSISFPEEGEKHLSALLASSHAIPAPGALCPVGQQGARLGAAGLTLDIAPLTSPTPCRGLRMTAPSGLSAAFIPPARPCEAAVALAEEADLAVWSASYLDRQARVAELYGTSTAVDAARLAAKARVRQLLLTGFAPQYELPNGFLHEARPHFADCHYAQDLTEYLITEPAARSYG